MLCINYPVIKSECYCCEFKKKRIFDFEFDLKALADESLDGASVHVKEQNRWLWNSIDSDTLDVFWHAVAWLHITIYIIGTHKRLAKSHQFTYYFIKNRNYTLFRRIEILEKREQSTKRAVIEIIRAWQLNCASFSLTNLYPIVANRNTK